MRKLIAAVLTLLFLANASLADKAGYLDLARQGWSYELRTTMVGRDMSIPVRINGRILAGASLCLVGEKPHPQSLKIINAFRALSLHTFGKPLTMRYAGADASLCGSGRTVVLRLYSGYPPNRQLALDLNWMNRTYELGLPPRASFAATSPAMAQTFFGRRGQSTHIMVKQPALTRLGRLETAFYKSLLVEELFQSFTFGMDILLFDRTAVFQSKLQETPLFLGSRSWESRAFMKALVRANPGGLCEFDVFMMHAVAEAPVDQTNEPGFIDYIDEAYEHLLEKAHNTMADPRFALIFDPLCQQAKADIR